MSAALGVAKKTVVLAGLAVGLSTAAVAQTDDDKAVKEYAALLQKIADMKTNIAHKQVFIGSQETEIASIQNQIDTVGATIESIDPMIEKMRVAISDEIETDLPFNAEERFDRLAGFDEIVADKDARAADKWRRALGIYEAEVSYGQSVQAYAANHPDESKAGMRLKACETDAESSDCNLSDDQKKRLKAGVAVADMAAGLKDGYYLRYGRLALAYQTENGAESYLYNPETKAWDAVAGSRALDLRRAVKMARGEAAPDVSLVPITVTN